LTFSLVPSKLKKGLEGTYRMIVYTYTTNKKSFDSEFKTADYSFWYLIEFIPSMGFWLWLQMMVALNTGLPVEFWCDDGSFLIACTDASEFLKVIFEEILDAKEEASACPY